MTHALDLSRILETADTEGRQAELAALRGLHPSDIAEVLEESRLEPGEVVEILSAVGNHKAIDAFAQLSMETQEACLEAGNAQTMLRFVENMEPDDRVDLLKAVDDEVREAIMPLIAQAERNAIRKLWHYEEGTAGAVMTTEYAMLTKDLTVGEALSHLRLQAPNKETIYYIYITDQQRRLIGTISLRDLIMSKPYAQLERIMETNLISAPHDMDIEEVAALFSKYDLLAVPVVDKENRLLGIITVDDVLDIIEAESTEDFQRISAVLPFDEEYFRRPFHRLFWSRFIWLAILLLTSLISTTIMEANQDALHQMLALSFFIPMVMGTCGNAGTQSATMIVRSMALGEIETSDGWRVFRRELLMGLALGVSLGLIAYFRVFLQDQHALLGIIVASALLATLLAANLVGALLPLILKKIKLDPALTAGPFIATIIDAVGIAIYFQIAFILMRTFQA
ncbi:magnesium transporter [Desulfatitalea alkaliphila]|uniref:Magnesium transporter MgtE n=1 Tax=Desulfatitalea alkaliphila TaxID=2929485 RepID=A0AA41R265_9BACT|nr:magnesium transporter [Desulfatitalea alkaliphila]MCJ8500376.1 magnesium transporter [Desulfatitalea alkaliphila]